MLLKRLGIAFLAILALGVTMAATASAENDPLFLFGGQTGTVSEGGGTLSTLTQFFSIECKKSAGTVKAANDVDTFEGEIEFKECTATGLGQAAGVIKFKIKGLTCLWGKETELKPCAVIENTENVHLEVPILGLVDFLAGSTQAGKLTPDGTSTNALKLELAKGAANGDQLLTSVKDLGKELKPKINVLENHKGEETMGAISATFLIKFTNAGTLDCS